MANCVNNKKNLGLYEEPTTYRYDYVHPPLVLKEKSLTVAQMSTAVSDAKTSDSSPLITRAHDTLQCLNYNKRVPFDIFWEPKDSVGISIKPLVRHKILGDPQREEVIRSRPRVYMVPSISLDEIQNSDTRKLLVNFTYMTTSNYACKSVWNDFEPERPCHYDIDNKKTCAKNIRKSPCILSARFQTEAHEWDKLQDRSVSTDGTCASKNSQQYSHLKDNKAEKESDQIKVKDLLKDNKLSIAYDKFHPTYSGYRPRIGLGIPLEKKTLRVVHPDLSVSQAVHQRHAECSTL